MASEPARPLIQFLHRIAGPPPDQNLTDRLLLERFAQGNDQAAFAVLMQRHGPMVLGVCRRLLRDAHDAEDAFQATFLVLAHKAKSIGQPELLGPWLHGVACRTAARARYAARRRARTREAVVRPERDPVVEAAGRELRQVLDEELGRLPAKYRAALVLHYLEGKSTEEVARQLGCPRGTVLSRLTRGRDRLRTRLVRRGVGLSVGVIAEVLAERAATAAVPEPLALGTVNAAVLTAAGQAAAGAIPARVAILTKGVLRAMVLRTLTFMAAVMLVGTVVAVGTVVGARPTPPAQGARPAPAAKPTASGQTTAPRDAERIVGTWAIVSVEGEGKKSPEGMFNEGRWTFTADGEVTSNLRANTEPGQEKPLKLDPEGPQLKGTFKLDPTQKPKQITISAPDGKGETQQGIYKFDDATLTICLGDDFAGATPPAEFATKAGTKLILFVLKRATDEEQLVGTWAAVSVEKGGQQLPEQKAKEGKLLFAADGKVTVNEGGRNTKATYKLDAAKKPKEITLTSDDGGTLLGIYKLERDSLTICMGAENGKDRPTEFASQAGTDVTLLVLKREKK